MKYLVEVIYHMTADDCPIYGIAFEEDENTCINVIPLEGNRIAADCCHQDAMELWGDYLRELELSWEWGTLYKTVLEVELIYTKDYYGEVDCDHTLDMLFHKEFTDFEEDKYSGFSAFEGMIKLNEGEK